MRMMKTIPFRLEEVQEREPDKQSMMKMQSKKISTRRVQMVKMKPLSMIWTMSPMQKAETTRESKRSMPRSRLLTKRSAKLREALQLTERTAMSKKKRLSSLITCQMMSLKSDACSRK